MDVKDIDTAYAKHLLRRICKAISRLCGTTISPNYYSDGMANIVSNDREIAAFNIHGKKEHVMFFNSAEDLICTLLLPKTILYFSPLGKNKVEIDTSKMFGTTLEELNVKLDLMKAQS